MSCRRLASRTCLLAAHSPGSWRGNATDAGPRGPTAPSTDREQQEQLDAIEAGQ
jgi:hypothetical protein